MKKMKSGKKMEPRELSRGTLLVGGIRRSKQPSFAKATEGPSFAFAPGQARGLLRRRIMAVILALALAVQPAAPGILYADIIKSQEISPKKDKTSAEGLPSETPAPSPLDLIFKPQSPVSSTASREVNKLELIFLPGGSVANFLKKDSPGTPLISTRQKLPQICSAVLEPFCCLVKVITLTSVCTPPAAPSVYDDKVNKLIHELLEIHGKFLSGEIDDYKFEEQVAKLEWKIKNWEKHRGDILSPETKATLAMLRQSLVATRWNAIMSKRVPYGATYTPEQLGITTLPPGTKMEFGLAEAGGKKYDGFWYLIPGKAPAFKSHDGKLQIEKVKGPDGKLLFTRQILKSSPSSPPEITIIMPDGSSRKFVNPHVMELRDKNGTLKGYQVSPESMQKLEETQRKNRRASEKFNGVLLQYGLSKKPEDKAKIDQARSEAEKTQKEADEEQKKLVSEIANSLVNGVPSLKNLDPATLMNFLNQWVEDGNPKDTRQPSRNMQLNIETNGKIQAFDQFYTGSRIGRAGDPVRADRSYRLSPGTASNGKQALIVYQPIMVATNGMDKGKRISRGDMPLAGASDGDEFKRHIEYIGNNERLYWDEEEEYIPASKWNPFSSSSTKIHTTLRYQRWNPKTGRWEDDPNKPAERKPERTVDHEGSSEASKWLRAAGDAPGIKQLHEYALGPLGSKARLMFPGTANLICGEVKSDELVSGAHLIMADIYEFRDEWYSAMNSKDPNRIAEARKAALEYIKQLRSREGKTDKKLERNFWKLIALEEMIRIERGRKWKAGMAGAGWTKEQEEEMKKRMGEKEFYDYLRKVQQETEIKDVTDEELVNFILEGDIRGSTMVADYAEMKGGGFCLETLVVVTKAGEVVIDNLPTLVLFHAFGALGQSMSAARCPAIAIPGTALASTNTVLGFYFMTSFGAEGAQAFNDAMRAYARGDKTKYLDKLGELAGSAALMGGMLLPKGGKHILERFKDFETERIKNGERLITVEGKLSPEAQKKLTPKEIEKLKAEKVELEKKMDEVNKGLNSLTEEVLKIQNEMLKKQQEAKPCPCPEGTAGKLTPEMEALKETKQREAKTISDQAKEAAETGNKSKLEQVKEKCRALKEKQTGKTSPGPETQPSQAPKRPTPSLEKLREVVPWEEARRFQTDAEPMPGIGTPGRYWVSMYYVRFKFMEWFQSFKNNPEGFTFADYLAMMRELHKQSAYRTEGITRPGKFLHESRTRADIAAKFNQLNEGKGGLEAAKILEKKDGIHVDKSNPVEWIDTKTGEKKVDYPYLDPSKYNPVDYGLKQGEPIPFYLEYQRRAFKHLQKYGRMLKDSKVDSQALMQQLAEVNRNMAQGNLFFTPNASIHMNMINGMLRDLGGRGIRHERLDLDAMSSEIDIYYKNFLRMIQEANPQGIQPSRPGRPQMPSLPFEITFEPEIRPGLCKPELATTTTPPPATTTTPTTPPARSEMTPKERSRQQQENERLRLENERKEYEQDLREMEEKRRNNLNDRSLDGLIKEVQRRLNEANRQLQEMGDLQRRHELEQQRTALADQLNNLIYQWQEASPQNKPGLQKMIDKLRGQLDKIDLDIDSLWNRESIRRTEETRENIMENIEAARENLEASRKDRDNSVVEGARQRLERHMENLRDYIERAEDTLRDVDRQLADLRKPREQPAAGGPDMNTLREKRSQNNQKIREILNRLDALRDDFAASSPKPWNQFYNDFLERNPRATPQEAEKAWTDQQREVQKKYERYFREKESSNKELDRLKKEEERLIEQIRRLSLRLQQQQ